MTSGSSRSVIPAATTVQLLRRGVMYWLLLRLMLLMVMRGKIGIGTLAANLGVWHGWYAVIPAVVSLTIDALLWTFVPGLREFTWIEL